MPDEDEEPLLGHGQNGLSHPSPTKRVERRCSRLTEGLERTPGVREGTSKRPSCPTQWVPHTLPSSRTNNETNNICTSQTLEESGFLDESMNDYGIMYDSVNDNDEQVYCNNINSLEMSRKEEKSEEESQNRGELDSRSMTRDAGRNNNLTNKQTNIYDSMNDKDGQVHGNSINSLEMSRKEKPGEDNQDRGELNSRPVTGNAGRNNNLTNKQFNSSTIQQKPR